MERAKRPRLHGYWHASRRTLIIFLVSFDKLAPSIRYPRFSCPPWFAWLHLTAPPLLLKSQISSSKRASFYFFSTFSNDSVCPNTRTSVYIRRYTDAEFASIGKESRGKGKACRFGKTPRGKSGASRRVVSGVASERNYPPHRGMRGTGCRFEGKATLLVLEGVSRKSSACKLRGTRPAGVALPPTVAILENSPTSRVTGEASTGNPSTVKREP